MINAEKYKSEILEIINNARNFAITKNSNEIKPCSERSDRECSECSFSACNNEEGCKFGCAFYKLNWLLSEYKEPVKLTRLEHEVLKHLLNDTEYRYIVRNKYRHEGGVFNLYIFKDKPFEDSGVWYSGRDSVSEFYVFNNLFAFVRWEDSEPTPIKEVLENCEVVNDAEE